MDRLYRATLNTFRGLAVAVRTEVAFRQEVVLLLVALPLGIFIAPGIAWYVAMIGALLVVLAVELLNTSIEKLADQVTLERRPEIGAIKDHGSAAVFCALVLTGMVWLAALTVRLGLF